MIHSWDLSIREAIALQKELREKLILRGGPRGARWIAGADAAFAEGDAIGAVVLWDAREKKLVEQHVARAPLRFPYMPGLLSFREAPALLAAFAKLGRRPDLVLFDGQGIAHPRGLGIASHLGLWLDLPTIGVAKSRLVGEHARLAKKKGSFVPLLHRGAQVGFVYRSRDGGNPLFLSPGHKIGMNRLIPLLKPCFAGYRLPEPTRLADRLSKRPASC